LDQTQHLKLPFILPNQAQKHVTVNENLNALDTLVQCAVSEMGRDTPPGNATEGARYLIGAAPTGVWTGQAGRLAHFRNNGWWFLAPLPGWRVYNLADDTLYVLTSAGVWAPLSGGGGGPVSEVQNATLIGLGMAADAANPFAAKLNAALWTARTPAEGGTGDLFIACNKTDSGRDAGFVFQSSFVTKAIAGLFGSNRFRLAVSQDGTAFNDALSVDHASGIVDQPRLPRFKAHTNFDNYVALETWTKIAINAAEANDQGVFDATTNRFTAPTEGLYALGASLLHKEGGSGAPRMRGRLVKNGTEEIPGSLGEISGAHVDLATALCLQTLAPLAAGDTVELQGYYRSADGYFAATHTTFWGFKIG
jgi:Protein of unknown function (DUF2793)